MYRITKILNHNAVLAINPENQKESLIIGKGVGFGKKPSEYTEYGDDVMVYHLTQKSDRGNYRDIVSHVEPVYLDVANQIIVEASRRFLDMDTNIIVPLSDHIAFAAKRILSGTVISNPLTQDIIALFPDEYEVARKAQKLIYKTIGLDFSEDELGYIALHIHSALNQGNITQAMQTARIVRNCMQQVQKTIGHEVDVSSLSYSRMMTHIKYMVARVIKGEALKIDMNDYMNLKCPKAFAIGSELCVQISNEMKLQIDNQEKGYLAIHIERVFELEDKENEGVQG